MCVYVFLKRLVLLMPFAAYNMPLFGSNLGSGVYGQTIHHCHLNLVLLSPQLVQMESIDMPHTGYDFLISFHSFHSNIWWIFMLIINLTTGISHVGWE